MEIVVRDVHKYFGAEHILKGMNFEIYKGEKVGLLGKNGSGKTTLFRIISGLEVCDEGSINIAGKASILAQIPNYPEEFSVTDVLKTSFDRLFNIKKEMTELERLMALSNPEAGEDITTKHTEDIQEQSDFRSIVRNYGILQTEFEAMGGYTIKSDIAKVCNGLGIDNTMQENLFNNLSGGEKTRVNLARIILEKSEILLLDEPTNHLDINMTEWLEEYILQYKGTVLVISHDRYFLDRIVKRIIEIVDGKSEFYEGNYTYYVKEKENRYMQKLQAFEQEQKKIKQLEEASRRMHQWANSSDNPSLHRRAFAMEKRIERLEKTEKPKLQKGMKASFKGIKFAGSDVVTIKELYKSYTSNCIVNGVSLTVNRGDRIALLGRNGCGKTTLLKLITGEEMQDSGTVKIGSSIKYALLPQIVYFENPELTILDTVRNELVVSEEAARNRLGAYHFRGEEVFKKVSVLSGGEKSRLKLCILMNSNINLLVLDEPTNHLDIAAKEWIEQAIDGFDGTLLFVSHDRYLVNRFATRIWDMKQGNIFDYRGTYEEYKKWDQSNKLLEEQSDKLHENSNQSKDKNKNKNKDIDNDSVNINDKDKSWKSKKERQTTAKIKEIEKEIMDIDERLEAIDDEMNNSASDYESLQKLLEEKEILVKRQDSLYSIFLKTC